LVEKPAHRILIIQDRLRDAKFIMDTITEKYPGMKLVTFDSILSAFHEIVYSKYDLILIDCDIEGFKKFSGVKLIRAFNDKVPIIVTCTEDQKFIGLRSVVEGADNYYIIRYDYQRMLCRIIAISLKLISPIDYIRTYANDDVVNAEYAQLSNQPGAKVPVQ
jgi:DNA-binding response OmpR family regulator